MFLRHIPFLKAVLLYACTAFGGPQVHIAMMVKTFAQKRKDVTEEELMEYNAFCQILPGPSSSQTVFLIAYRRGGIPLALLTLLIWIMPATLLMASFSYLLLYLDTKQLEMQLFSLVKPMSLGFIIYAAIKMMQKSVKHTATWAIMIGSIAVTVFVKSPWVFPSIIVAAGIISNFSDKRIPGENPTHFKVNWNILWLFFIFFASAGILSEWARLNHWEHRRVFNLFENFYRFGSIVFGGGQALIPMMLYQFVTRPQTPWINQSQLLTGYGMLQAVPGPVFSICTFVGGIAMSSYGPFWQLMGCLTATIGVFLPSTLLLLFLFPLYQNLKNYVVIFRSLEGINAAIVGIVWASGIILFRQTAMDLEPTTIVVAGLTFAMLYYTKIPAPLIVFAWLLLGWVTHQ
ncbi:MAG: chromate efflux transporter [Chitinophagaceae bacterium]|nr:chromate efflux transporter [Chitinophagaceae bacterium]